MKSAEQALSNIYEQNRKSVKEQQLDKEIKELYLKIMKKLEKYL